MEYWLRWTDGTMRLGRFLAAVTVLGVSWNAAVPARAADEPATRNSASDVNRVAGDAASSETMYAVTYTVADILSKIQDERRLNAEGAKEFLGNRVKGPPVMQLAFDRQRHVRFGRDPQWLKENLVVVASQMGHEQVSAMLAAFRKYGIVEYAISARFITMTESNLKAFPDSTSSFLTTNQNPTSSSEAASLFSEIPLGHAGTTAIRARTIIEEDLTMRFHVLDKDALAKLLNSVNSDRRSNVLEAPRVTTFLGQTASLSDHAHSRFAVGANLLPSGSYELKMRDVAEGTALLVRPVAEPNGDIRLNFAASFTTIDNVTKEVLKIAPDKEIVLQLPKVATCHVDGGVVLKPGQSLMFGSVKGLTEGRTEGRTKSSCSKKREEQQLILILQVEPFERAADSPQLSLGVVHQPRR